MEPIDKAMRMNANIEIVAKRLEEVSAEISNYEHKIHVAYVDIANKFSEIRFQNHDIKVMNESVIDLQEDMRVLMSVLEYLRRSNHEKHIL